MHPILPFDPRRPGELESAQQAGEEILDFCISVGGSISGEHGVGMEKMELMAHQFPPETLDLIARLKALFDPACSLNPGKLLADSEKAAWKSGNVQPWFSEPFESPGGSYFQRPIHASYRRAVRQKSGVVLGDQLTHRVLRFRWLCPSWTWSGWPKCRANPPMSSRIKSESRIFFRPCGTLPKNCAPAIIRLEYRQLD